MIHGKDLIVTIEGRGAIAAARSCKISVSQSLLDVCSPTSGRTMEKVPTTYSWSIGCECFCRNTQDMQYMLEAIKQGTKMTLTWTVGGVAQTGEAYISSFDINGTVRSMVSISVNFDGSGPLTTSAAGIDDAMFIDEIE